MPTRRYEVQASIAILVKGRTWDRVATLTFEISLNLEGYSDSHERGRYKGADLLTLVLRFGQLHKLVVKFFRFPAFLSRFDSVHGRSVECFKAFYELCWAFVGRRKFGLVDRCCGRA